MGNNCCQQADDKEASFRQLQGIVSSPQETKKTRDAALAQFKELDKDKKGFLDSAQFENNMKAFAKGHGLPEPTSLQIKTALAPYKSIDGKINAELYQNLIIDVIKEQCKSEAKADGATVGNKTTTPTTTTTNTNNQPIKKDGK